MTKHVFGYKEFKLDDNDDDCWLYTSVFEVWNHKHTQMQLAGYSNGGCVFTTVCDCMLFQERRKWSYSIYTYTDSYIYFSHFLNFLIAFYF